MLGHQYEVGSLVAMQSNVRRGTRDCLAPVPSVGRQFAGRAGSNNERTGPQLHPALLASLLVQRSYH